MFRNAIVRRPCQAISDGLTTSDLGKPVYSVALEQHLNYSKILEEAGLKVKVLPANETYPDSTFIEDVALCTKSFAVITSPGALSRRGEISGIRETLSDYYSTIEEIKLPGTVEAGDIMMVGDHFFIGISDRTNITGATSLISILQKHGYTGSCVPLKKMLHLKSGVSYLENNILLVCGEFINAAQFKGFDKIIVDAEEAYAANSLWINEIILVPDGFPKTREKIEKAGYTTIIIDVSEFRKIDGGLSCLSLRF
jgi:dimethylargininase